MTRPDQATITKAFPGLSTGAMLDVIHGFLWDSIEFDRGATIDRANSFFFRRPISESRTWCDTNMVTSSRLDAPEQFSIQRILFTFSKLCLDVDTFTIMESFMFRFWMGCKYFVSTPIISLPTVSVPTAPIKTCEYCQSVYANQEECPRCGATHFTLSSVGDCGGTQYVMDLAVPLLIVNQMSFYATLEGNQYTFQSKFKMWVHLEGLHAREVQ
jgi:hypothetical protein